MRATACVLTGTGTDDGGAEVEAVVTEEGLTKNAMGKLVKVDSFLRESQRHSNMLTSTRRRFAFPLIYILPVLQ